VTHNKKRHYFVKTEKLDISSSVNFRSFRGGIMTRRKTLLRKIRLARFISLNRLMVRLLEKNC
jgi:hypothetical protein